MFILKTLGTVELTGPEGELLTGRRKELALLAYLARGPGRASRDELATLLWSERQQARARHSLRQALLRLRRTLGEEVLSVEGEGVTFHGPAIEVDANQFLVDVAAGRLERAAALWAGHFLPGMDDVGGEPWLFWLHAQRETLLTTLAGTLEELVRAGRAEGGPSRARPWATRWVELQPLAEHPVALLIGLLRAEGRTAEALGVHEAFVGRVARELEAEPSPAFMALRAELEGERETDAPGRTPRSIALFTPELAGRGAALSGLEEAWRGALSGEAVVVVVEGEAGIGKTRACEEFLRSLDSGAAEAQVFRARSREDDPPYAALQELLGSLPGAPGLGGVSDAALGEIASQVPAIRSRFAEVPVATGDPRRLARAVREALEVVAEEASTLLFLDDVALMDEATRVTLRPTLANPPPGSMVLITVRGLADAPWLREVLPEAGGRRHLKLGPLGEEDMEALLASMLALSPRDRGMLAARLEAECGGNPLFAVELVSGLVDEGHLIPDARGVWKPADPDVTALSLPRSLRETVRRRLTDLSKNARGVACVAAFLREPIEVRRLAEVLRIPGDLLREALEELLGRRLLREPPMRPGSVEFVHAIVRRVAAEQLTPDGRRILEEAGVPVRPGAGAHYVLEERSSAGSAPPPSTAGKVPVRRRRVKVAAAMLSIATVIGWSLWTMAARTSAPPGPLLAVGGLEDLREGSDPSVIEALSDMLATNLARVPGLQVVSSARMYELMGQLGSTEAQRAALAGAARQAGASQLLEGSVLAGPRGMRLDLRRVDLRSGAVIHAERVDGADLFQLVDVATTAVATSMGLPGESLHLADATTSSLVAYRFYEEGLRKYARADYRSAAQLFDAALAQDSSFALAAFYRWRARSGLGQSTSQEELDRMLELASHAPDRDRLLIRGNWAVLMNDPILSVIADTLAIRYPAEPEGQYLIGLRSVWEGSFPEGIAALARVVAVDSLGLQGAQARCLACDALDLIVETQAGMDSAAAAERTAREWLRVQPRSARAWQSLAAALLAGERYEEANQARARATELNPIDTHDAVFPAIANIYESNFTDADALLGELGRGGVPAVRGDALWFLAISLRNQGRYAEALSTLRTGAAEAAHQEDNPVLMEALRRHEGQVLLEMGRYREAAALFDSLAGQPRSGMAPGVVARHQVLNLTELATVRAAAGDTASLTTLADSVEAWGRRSAYGRDRRLHHHVRGLLFVARNELDAAEAEFEAAIYSPTTGYTRTNLELARVLMAQGRPGEAVAVLAPALRSQLEGSNLYVTRTELRLWLGRAWDAAAVADSAKVQYRRVVQNWRVADPGTRERADSVGARLRALGS